MQPIHGKVKAKRTILRVIPGQHLVIGVPDAQDVNEINNCRWMRRAGREGQWNGVGGSGRRCLHLRRSNTVRLLAHAPIAM